MGLIFYYGIQVYAPEPISDTMQGVISIAPITVIYVVAFLRYASLNTNEINDEEGRSISPGSFTVQYFVLGLFVFCLVGGIIWLFETGALKFEDIPLFTSGLETVFGAYLAIIFHKLFPASVFVSEGNKPNYNPTEANDLSSLRAK